MVDNVEVVMTPVVVLFFTVEIVVFGLLFVENGVVVMTPETKPRLVTET